MYKIIYENNRVIIQKNMAPKGFIPLWENWIIAYSSIDIPEEFWLQLSDDDSSQLEWFFLDLKLFEGKIPENFICSYHEN